MKRFLDSTGGSWRASVCVAAILLTLVCQDALAARFLDAIGVAGWRAPVRVMQASQVTVRPAIDRIYFRFGGGVIVAYKLSTFFSRLDAGEALVWPFPSASQALQQRGGMDAAEKILAPEVAWSVDMSWQHDNRDTDEILSDFDVDDQGNIYVAGTIFGWGILGPGMNTVHQNRFETQAHVIALKGASGKYYALPTGSGGSSIYDASTRKTPVKLGVAVPRVQSWAKTSDAGRVALINTTTRELTIHTADGLATSAQPLYRETSHYTLVTTDGTNFYALNGGNSITVLVPSGDTYRVAGNFPLDPTMLNVRHISYGDGYLTVSGSGNQWAYRLYRITPGAMTLVPIDVSATTGAQGVNTNDGTVSGNHLILCALSVGDVYEIAAAPPDTPPVKPPVTPPSSAPDHDTTYRLEYPGDDAGLAAAQAQYESMVGIYSHFMLGKRNDGKIIVSWY